MHTLDSLPTLAEDTTTPLTSTPCVVRAAEGVFCQGPGEASLFKFAGEHTANNVTLSRTTVDVNSGPPPHVHGNEDEVFVVHSGAFEFFANGQLLEARTGDVVYGARGEAHRFRGLDSGEPNVFSIIVAPSGFEHFMAQWVQLFEAGAPDMDVALRLCGEYNITLFPSDELAPRVPVTKSKLIPASQPLALTSNLDAVVLLSTADTQGRHSMVRLNGTRSAELTERTVEAADQMFLVETGQAEFALGEETVIVEAGDTVWVPRGCQHGLRVMGDAAQIAVFMTPGGEETRFAPQA